MSQISNGLFGAESVRPGPRELGTRDVGFGKVWIQRERLLNLDEGFLLPAGIGIVLKEPEDVRSSQCGMRQCESWIEYCRPLKESHAAIRHCPAASLGGIAVEQAP